MTAHGKSTHAIVDVMAHKCPDTVSDLTSVQGHVPIMTGHNPKAEVLAGP